MQANREKALDILARLGSHPATAFYESGVAGAVKAILGENGVEWSTDSYGNIVALVPGTGPESRDIPPVAFVAHMDHPGFEAVARDGDLLVGKAAGGVPAGSFAAGIPLQVVTASGERWAAVTAGPHGDAADRQVLIRMEGHQPAEVELPCSVVFDLVDFTLDEGMIRMRALDDLAGCASTLSALAVLAREQPPGPVYGVFTRAEEVGLVGARLMAEAGTLPMDTLVVSLESSRTLPGAEIGGGPVIRVGDAGSTFSAEAEAVLIRARETLLERSPEFRVQRQLMSGGVCEASAFGIHGYRCTGMAFPLGNYHNGAPEDRIEAEYIDCDDFLGGVELILEAARSVVNRGDTAFQRRLRDMPEEFRERMAGG